MIGGSSFLQARPSVAASGRMTSKNTLIQLTVLIRIWSNFATSTMKTTMRLGFICESSRWMCQHFRSKGDYLTNASVSRSICVCTLFALTPYPSARTTRLVKSRVIDMYVANHPKTACNLWLSSSRNGGSKRSGQPVTRVTGF